MSKEEFVFSADGRLFSSDKKGYNGSCQVFITPLPHHSYGETIAMEIILKGENTNPNIDPKTAEKLTLWFKYDRETWTRIIARVQELMG